jgi:ribosomal protein S18 acetylase RimI-like enzyme
MGSRTANIHVVRMTNKHPKFYARMGPFLARRGIVEEIGAPIWDDDEKEWFVAIEKRRFSVVGFSALTIDSGRTARIASTWVAPDYRRAGVGRRLLTLQMKAAHEKADRVKVTASSLGLALFRGAGFKITNKRGRFSVMEYAHA